MVIRKTAECNYASHEVRNDAWSETPQTRAKISYRFPACSRFQSVRPSVRLSSVTESLAHANCFLPGNRERFLLRETARPESDGRGRPSFPSPPVRQQQSRWLIFQVLVLKNGDECPQLRVSPRTDGSNFGQNIRPEDFSRPLKHPGTAALLRMGFKSIWGKIRKHPEQSSRRWFAVAWGMNGCQVSESWGQEDWGHWPYRGNRFFNR